LGFELQRTLIIFDGLLGVSLRGEGISKVIIKLRGIRRKRQHVLVSVTDLSSSEISPCGEGLRGGEYQDNNIVIFAAFLKRASILKTRQAPSIVLWTAIGEFGRRQ